MIRVLGIYNFGTHTNKMVADSSAKIPQMPQKISVHNVCPSPKFKIFEKRSLSVNLVNSTEVCSPTPNWNDFEYDEDLFG